MSLNRKFISLLALNLVMLVVMVYLVSLFTRPSSGAEKGLKLIHKGHHTNVQLANTSKAPPTTPTQPNLLAEHVKRTCESLKMGKPGASILNPDRYDHILVDDRYKMLYCYVPKVACTNWRRIMLVLSGKVKVSNVMQITGGDVHLRYKHTLPRLSQMSEAEIRHRLDNYFKFMFVREPFERLLSAWRNKFQNSANPYFRKQFGQTILRRFRDSGEVKKDGSKSGVHFEEFLQYLVDPLRTEALNEHWATYHRLCLPCSVGYDFVGRYENIEQDALHVLTAVHADRVVRFPERLASYKHNETSAYLGSFYRNLSAPLLRRVYRIYRKDFLLFRYSLPKELQWAFRGAEGAAEVGH